VSSAQHAIEKAYYRDLPQPWTSVLAGLVVLGAAAFFYGLATDPTRAWLAYHTNFVFFSALSLGGLVLASIFVIVGAVWPGPLRRYAEGLAAFVPVCLALSIVGYFGGDHLFEWMREGAIPAKAPWLNKPRFYAVNIGIYAVLTAMCLLFLRRSIRPTLGGTADKASEGFARNLVNGWTQGWKGDREEKEEAFAKLSPFSPKICLVFAIGFSIVVFDQVMSMEQMWFSNLFGAFVSWGGILSAVAAIALVAVLNKNTPGIGHEITEDRLHDIGKLIFAFSTFWMYLFWAQYLVIYYGNLPEETMFFYDRLGPQFLIDKGFTDYHWAMAWAKWDFDWARLSEGYGWVSMAVWSCNWLIPFWVLLGQRPKKTTWILGPVAAILLLGLWLERNVLIWPSVIKGDMSAPFGLVPVLIGLGFVSAFVLVFMVYTRVFPGTAISVPEEG